VAYRCGLRASRILRGRECHVHPCNVLGFVVLGPGFRVLGLVHETDEAYKERKQLLAEGIEENESRQLPSPRLVPLVPHLVLCFSQPIF
jgi:hypothetical protein